MGWKMVGLPQTCAKYVNPSGDQGGFSKMFDDRGYFRLIPIAHLWSTPTPQVGEKSKIRIYENCRFHPLPL